MKPLLSPQFLCPVKKGNTALLRASQYNHPNVVKLLLEAGADVFTENKVSTAMRLVEHLRRIKFCVC
jgi:ankyrin repeat protein